MAEVNTWLTVSDESNVREAKWSPETGQMLVNFKSGSTYYYDNVSADEWAEWEAKFGTPEGQKHFTAKFRFWEKGLGKFED